MRTAFNVCLPCVLLGLALAGLAGMADLLPAAASAAVPAAIPAETQVKENDASVRDAQNTLLAWQLAHYARSHNDPMALSTAALMLRQIQPSTAQPGGQEKRTPVPAAAPTPESLLDEADALAKTQGNGALRELIGKWRKQSAGRGIPSGAVQHATTLPPGEVHRFVLEYKPEEDATLGFVILGTAGLLVAVNPPLPEIPPLAQCLPSCQFNWKPGQSSRYEVQVRHDRPDSVQYLMVTN